MRMEKTDLRGKTDCIATTPQFRNFWAKIERRVTGSQVPSQRERAWIWQLSEAAHPCQRATRSCSEAVREWVSGRWDMPRLLVRGCGMQSRSAGRMSAVPG